MREEPFTGQQVHRGILSRGGWTPLLTSQHLCNSPYGKKGERTRARETLGGGWVTGERTAAGGRVNSGGWIWGQEVGLRILALVRAKSRASHYLATKVWGREQ